MAEDCFSIRVVAIDYYLSRPVTGVDVCYSHLQGAAVTQIPVIRIFGSTPAGQKVCLHLHKVTFKSISNVMMHKSSALIWISVDGYVCRCFLTSMFHTPMIFQKLQQMV